MECLELAASSPSLVMMRFGWPVYAPEHLIASASLWQVRHAWLRRLNRPHIEEVSHYPCESMLPLSQLPVHGRDLLEMFLCMLAGRLQVDHGHSDELPL